MKRLAPLVVACATALACVGALAGCTSPSQSAEPGQPNEPATADAQAEAEPEPLTVKESGYYIDEYGYGHYAVIVENPNMSWAASGITLSITSKDASGNIVGSSKDTATVLFANGTTAFCGTTFDSVAPATLEFQVSVTSNGWSHEDLSMSDFAARLPIEGLNEVTGSYGQTTFAGQATNTGDGTFLLPQVNIVLRDANGSIVGGYATYLDGDFTAGATLPFSTTESNVPAHASIEAYLDCGYPES